ncbi:hypothetical protein JCM10449v2_005688 [Rhodotorula kratochvilovae]
MATSVHLDATDGAMKSGGATTDDQDERVKGPSLLDLPDDLLIIFRYVFVLECDEKRNGSAVAPDRIRLTKRIHALASPIFLEFVRFPYLGKYGASRDAFFGWVVRQSDYWHHVRHLEILDLTNAPFMTTATLIAFRNLRSLSIVSSGIVPARLTSAIRTLKNLSDLALTAVSGLTDDSFDLRKTAIRRLDGSSSLAVEKMLQGGRGNSLLELILRINDLRGYEVPWQSLRVLRLKGSGNEGVSAGAPIFLQSLENATSRDTPLPLVTFELSMHGSSANGTPAFAEGQARRIELLCAVLRVSEATQLKLSCLPFCPVFETAEVFPCVRRLDLQGTAPLWKTDNLEALHSLLSHLPSLTQLSISAFPFHDSHASLVTDYSIFPPVRFGLRYPAFNAFLVLIRSTAVLDIEYDPETEPLMLHYARASVHEDFSAEVIRLMALPLDFDKTDGAMKSGGGNTDDQDERPLGPSLLDLPDELIAHTLETVQQGGFRGPQYELPLSMICLNKRIYRVALPLWYRSLRFPDVSGPPEHFDAFYAWLLRTSHQRRLTRHVDYEHDPEHPVLQRAFLATFTHLQGLAFCVQSSPPYEHYLWELLRALPALQKLQFDDEREYDDPAPLDLSSAGFRLLRDSTIKHLKVQKLSQAAALLGAVGTRRLQQLEVTGRSAFIGEDSPLPWISSERIDCRHPLTVDAINAPVDNLQHSNIRPHVQPIKLLGLTVRDNVSFDPASGEAETSYWAALERLLKLLRPRHLRLYNIRAFPPVSRSTDDSLGATEFLELLAMFTVKSSTDLLRLHAFVDLFPSLARLSLSYTNFQPGEADGDAARDFCALDRTTFALRHPFLAAFLGYLRTTRILHFRQYPSYAGLVCWRASATEEFEADSFTSRYT